MALVNKTIIELTEEVEKIQKRIREETKKLGTELSFTCSEGDVVKLKTSESGNYFKLSDGRNVFKLRIDNIEKTLGLFQELYKFVNENKITIN